MTDPVEPSSSEPAPESGPDLPRATVARRKRRQISLVWIVPAVAVLVGIYLVIHAIRTTGPTIEIEFKNAEGVEAGKTKIKYKSVDIGTVDTVNLGKDRKSVIVTAKIIKSATDLLVEDSRFWIVKPRIAGGQVSGLNTLLSGAYIGMDYGKSNESRREFVALESQPAVTTDEPGHEYVLHASDIGSLDINSPVYFRRIEVGQITAITLDEDGKGVTMKVFIHAPHDKYVTKNTRFWQASGVDVSIGGGGVKISTQSLSSILVGGIAFQAPPDDKPGPPAAQDAAFTLFNDERTAMRPLDDQVDKFMAFFTQSISGLAVGASVEFRGYPIGEVRSIDIAWNRDTQRFEFPVEYVIYKKVAPARVQSAGDENANRDEFLVEAIEKRGLRAQLRTGNLFTGAKVLSLDFFKDEPPVKVKTLRSSKGAVVVPTKGGSLDELQETLNSISKKIDRIPFEQIAKEVDETLKQMRTTLKGAERTLAQINDQVAPQISAALDSVKATMRNAENALASDSPLQQDLRTTLVELTRASASLRLLTDYLQRHPDALLRGKAPDLDLGRGPGSPPGVTPQSSGPEPARRADPPTVAPPPARPDASTTPERSR